MTLLAGIEVDWTVPPYRVGGLVRLVLAGETAADVSPAVYRQRIAEYSAQARRGARIEWGDSLGHVARVFAPVDA